MASSTTTLPAVCFVMSIACSSGTPAPISAENVRDQRARATFWKMSPILNGMRSRKRCHMLRPRVVFFHLMNATVSPMVPSSRRYQ